MANCGACDLGLPHEHNCRDCGRSGEHAHWCETEAYRKTRERVWDETVQAFAWAIDNGPDPLTYVRDNNPYRAKPCIE